MEIEDDLISIDVKIFLQMLLMNRRDMMPNFTAAVYKYAALGPSPRESTQKVISLTEMHVQESWLHHSMIVLYALRTAVIINGLDAAILKKLWRIRDSQKRMNSKLFSLKLDIDYIELEMIDESFQENNQRKQNGVKTHIQEFEQRIAVAAKQEKELVEMRKRADNFFQTLNELVAQHEILWQDRQQEANSNLISQLKKLHNITLTKEDLASLHDDTSKSIATKKATLEKNQIQLTKKVTFYEILVRYAIWEWLNRSLIPVKKEPKIFESLLPYFKQENYLREKLKKEIDNKHSAIKNEVNNLKKIVDEFDIDEDWL